MTRDSIIALTNLPPLSPNHTHKITTLHTMVKVPIQKTRLSDRIDHYKYSHPFLFLRFRTSSSPHKDLLLNYLFKLEDPI